MSYSIFTDSSANLTPAMATEWGIEVIPLHYCMEGEEEKPCFGVDFDAHAFYDALRARKKVHTSMVNEEAFMDAFEPVLAAGKDLIYVGMSSGISGTVQAAHLAAEELRVRFPGRVIHIKDSLAASLGEAMFLERISVMRAMGKSLEACARWFDDNVQRLNQYLAVDDLMFLRAGGRISGISAVFGSLAHIKPVLFGNKEGKFSMADRSAGRKKSIRYMANRFFERCEEPEKNTVMIAHADCESDAESLIRMIVEKYPGQRILSACYEPGTGAHAGPNALALFFFGKTR